MTTSGEDSGSGMWSSTSGVDHPAASGGPSLIALTTASLSLTIMVLGRGRGTNSSHIGATSKGFVGTSMVRTIVFMGKGCGGRR